MTTLNKEMVAEIRKRFCDAGQGHVFTWWDDLSSEEREGLFQQLTSIDLDLMNRLAEENLGRKSEERKRVFEPMEILPLPETPAQERERAEAARAGEDMIRQGRCAAFVVAGSVDSPSELLRIKGKVPITPVMGKSLFQLHAEKVIALRARYGVNIPLFVMTSPDNHRETQGFFEENGYFGMPAEDIFFFMQGMLPAVDFSGKLLMQTTNRLWMGPDGHGGSIRSLYTSGALEEMERRGISYIFYFQVDNPLTVILDPVFVGYHHQAGAEISSKVVRKRDPEERVGVLGRIDGWPGMVEYSDLTKEEKYAKDERGLLKFFAGNTAIHVLNVDFVRRLGKGSFPLRFHKVLKTVDTLDEKGAEVKAAAPNAVKFESFVFDALKYARTTVSLEVSRDEEFAPCKNLEGENSPEFCRDVMTRLYRSWLEKAGFSAAARDGVGVEISPLFALDAEEFRRKVKERGELFCEKLFIE